MADVMNYVKENYKKGEPIFPEDVAEEMGISVPEAVQGLAGGMTSEDLRQFDEGTYYMPEKLESVGFLPLSAEAVAYAKYILRRGKRLGYYTGTFFANSVGLTTQVPYVRTIANNAAYSPCTVQIDRQYFKLIHPKAGVTGKNYYLLQILDLLEEADYRVDYDISDAYRNERLQEYGEMFEPVTAEELDELLLLYPHKVGTELRRNGLYEVFTRGQGKIQEGVA